MKFFYDNFDSRDVCGLYTLGHFFTIFLFALTMATALYFSRKVTDKQIKKLHWTAAVVITLLEGLKITFRIIKGHPVGDWIPLYYCSLFIYAIWLSLCKVKFLSRMGYAYMCLGGVGGSLFFSLYPSTSLAIYPLWHPSVWYSFLYHWTMFYMGVLFLWKGKYVPKSIDGLYYFLFIVAVCIPSFFINEVTGSNCMFLHDPFKLPILDGLLQFSRWAYIAVVVFAQSVALFWASYFLDYRIRKRRQKKWAEAPAEEVFDEEEIPLKTA